MATRKVPTVPMDEQIEPMAPIGQRPQAPMTPRPMESGTPTTTTPPSPSTTAPSTTSTTVPPDLTKMTPAQIQAYLQGLSQPQGTTGLPSTYVPPERKYTDKTGKVKTYSGNQLINLSTGELRSMYMINQDPTAYIAQKLTADGPQGLLKFLKNIQSLGFYQGGRVGNGTSDNDISAVANFMRYSNMQGLQIDSALVMAQKQIPGTFRVDTGGRSVTNEADLRAVFESVAMSTLGRGLSDSQIKAMVAAYQQQERSAGFGGTAAPSAQTYANDLLRSKFKGEAQDFRAMNVADSMLNIIRSS